MRNGSRAPLCAVACAIILWLCMGDAPAVASVIRAMTPGELAAGADAVVEGRVLTISSTWNRDRTGLETRVQVEITRILAGHAEPVIVIVQPGGEVDGNLHVIPGMPAFAPDERVRLYLRRLQQDGHYRVYGWNQGKQPAQDSESIPGTTLEPAPGESEGSDAKRRADSPYLIDREPIPGTASQRTPGDSYFTHNGMVWPATKIPVRYRIHQAGSEDVPPAEAHAAIMAAFDTWQAVPCSTLSYLYDGDTDLGVAVDGVNALLWIESGWIYGEEAAAATSLWIPVEAERTADVAFNGQNFTWAIAPEPAISFSTLDIQAVLTHELGHFSGLGHTQSSVDTMYFSWRPWAGQRSLSADDKLGLCALYPQSADECADSSACPDDDPCLPHTHGTLCTPAADPMGAPCSYQRIECEHFCLFTAADLSNGYCSRFCEQQGDCPSGFACAAASAGGQDVKVCFVDASPQPDAGPGPDMCADDIECPAGRYCGADSQCTYDCVEAIDCPRGQVCGERGRCAPEAASQGCGCAASSDKRPWPPGSMLWLLALLALAWRRRSGRRGSMSSAARDAARSAGKP